MLRTLPNAWSHTDRRLMPDYNLQAKVYWFSMVALAVVCCAFAAWHTIAEGTVWVAALGIGAALFASAFPVRLTVDDSWYTLTGMVTLFVLLQAGPWPAILVATADGAMAAWRATDRWTTRLATPASFGLTMFVVGWCWKALFAAAVDAGIPADAALVFLTVAAGAAEMAMSTTACRMLRTLKRKLPLDVLELISPVMGPVLLSSLAVALLTIAARQSPTVMCSSGVVGAVLVLGVHLQGQRRAARVDEAAAQASALHSRADHDALTGAWNRGYLDRELRRHMDAARRDGRPLAIALMDLDRFGRFNKEHGTPTGDAVLRAFVDIAESSRRASDWIGRYGGEEFVLVIAGSLQDAGIVAERLRGRLAETDIAHPASGGSVRVTVSVGVAAFEPGMVDADALFQRASDALNAAKRLGRNRVETAA